MFGKLKNVFSNKSLLRSVVVLPIFLIVLSTTACIDPLLNFFWSNNQPDGSSSSITSIEINGIPYNRASGIRPVLVTDEIFQFKVVLQNNGITTWGNAASGQHGASLLSRGHSSHDPNDYNETFGTFFVIYPWQNHLVVRPGESMTYDTILRTPSTPGTYTMRWQTAEWPLGMSQGSHISETNQSLRNREINYFNRPFFGQ